MQLFAKRRSGKSTTEVPTKEPEEEVVSYFAANDVTTTPKSSIKKKKSVTPMRSVEELKKMNPETLNAKQRRLLKRMLGRENAEAPETETVQERAETLETETIQADTERDEDKDRIDEDAHDYNEFVESNGKSEDNDDTSNSITDHTIVEKTSDSEVDLNQEKIGKQSELMNCLIADQMKMLEGLNSKERRKLKRQFEREQTDSTNGDGASGNSQVPTSNIQNKEGKKSRKKIKDLSHLPPEERERRERQREMQRLAAERRDNRDASNNNHAHPLNSERRRANRRKPGKTVKMAMMRREAKERRAGMSQYNAYGYNMRRTKS